MSVVIYLADEMREKFLEYDIEHSEHTFDRDMYYITNTEKKILHDIIDGFIGWREEELRELGFNPCSFDFKLLGDGEFTVEFTEEKRSSVRVYDEKTNMIVNYMIGVEK